MMIKAIPVGMYQANCYIVMDENTKECAILDPGADSSRIEKVIETLGANPKMILLTHGHFDHVGAVEKLVEKYNIPFYINKKDEEMIDRNVDVFGKIPKANGYLNEDEVIKLSDEYEVKCIETPGHTPGGVCLLIGDCLFTGDTLFRESIGRSDFEGGNHATLLNSINKKIVPLGDNIAVYPGHGPSSTIKHERQRNPFLAGDFYVY
ncbi:MBL fold metallo-hydrolase [Clostridium sp. B9]|uniref:MBL fold metallo-hydrolase n=1 Tax=Clostridium sp. B9 TaxID=3423224 RepID=UPI003D2F0EED